MYISIYMYTNTDIYIYIEETKFCAILSSLKLLRCIYTHKETAIDGTKFTGYFAKPFVSRYITQGTYARDLMMLWLFRHAGDENNLIFLVSF